MQSRITPATYSEIPFHRSDFTDRGYALLAGEVSAEELEE
jgi:hypothetical protein